VLQVMLDVFTSAWATVAVGCLSFGRHVESDSFS